MTKQSIHQEQFIVSYDLLKLLSWLIEHEPAGLEKLVNQALNNGLRDELISASDRQRETAGTDLQEDILNFFMLLESVLHESVQDHDTKNLLQRNRIPALVHIDTSTCDQNSIALSAAKAHAAYEKQKGAHAQEVLYKELLKRWKPTKNQVSN